VPQISRIIITSGPFRRFQRLTDRIVLPGFSGLSLYEVGKSLFKEIRVNKLNVRGAAVTYNFLMAIPPSLLFLCSLVPYLPLKGVQESILTILKVVTPNDSTYSSFEAIVVDFLNNERRDILSFGILSTFFFSSNGIMGLMQSFDRSLPMYIKRGAIRRRWTALKLTAMVLAVVIFTIAALILQAAYINSIIEQVSGVVALVKVLTFFIIISMIFMVICMTYTYGPSLTQRFPFFSAGAVLATILCVVLSAVFFFLVKHVILYNKVYGSIGTLMAFMVWVFLNTQVILLGYELNVSILLAKLSRSNPARQAPEAA
jgi:membrane protein